LSVNVALTTQALSEADRQVIVRDLGELNRAESGLGDAVAAYVLTDAGGTVLSRIATGQA
jgi:hypothetical protein